jgi:tripartite-type tricarboxylate transporter receptor subunit TctC
MSIARRHFLRVAVGATALPDSATAQVYPARPITIVVPYAAGGSLDLLARILAERMRATFGQSIVVENVVGANGSIAVGRVARAAT